MVGKVGQQQNISELHNLDNVDNLFMYFDARVYSVHIAMWHSALFMTVFITLTSKHFKKLCASGGEHLV
jgi:hypothetical protein